jgi:hypothetical protein
VGGRYFGRKPLMGCLFHGSTSAAVMDAMPSLNVHQQTLHNALAVDPWREHSIFVTHNDPNTKKPKVNMKEVPFALRIQHHTRTTHTHTHTHTLAKRRWIYWFSSGASVSSRNRTPD